MMFSTIAIRRITKARRAMMNAQNPQFKEYWKKVIDQLSEGLGD
jgi:hypothetical protein